MSRPKRWPRMARRPHHFVAGAADPDRCAACPLPEGNQVHNPANLRTATAEQRARDNAVLGEHEDHDG